MENFGRDDPALKSRATCSGDGLLAAVAEIGVLHRADGRDVLPAAGAFFALCLLYNNPGLRELFIQPVRNILYFLQNQLRNNKCFR